MSGTPLNPSMVAALDQGYAEASRALDLMISDVVRPLIALVGPEMAAVHVAAQLLMSGEVRNVPSLAAIALVRIARTGG